MPFLPPNQQRQSTEGTNWVVPEKGPLNGCVCVCVLLEIKSSGVIAAAQLVAVAVAATE